MRPAITPDTPSSADETPAVRITLQGAPRLYAGTEARPLERKGAGLLAYLVLAAATALRSTDHKARRRLRVRFRPANLTNSSP